MEKEEKHKEEKRKEEKQKTEEKAEKPRRFEEKQERSLVRIAATDIPITLSVYAGLTKIKGVSWSLSNAICHSLSLDRTRKISALSQEEIDRIMAFIKNPKLPEWLLNRKKDIETGISKHVITTELDLQREFDIRRMRRIRSYKGVRHALGLPVRGQRTKAHFRKGRAVGVTRSKAKPAAAAGAKK